MMDLDAGIETAASQQSPGQPTAPREEAQHFVTPLRRQDAFAPRDSSSSGDGCTHAPLGAGEVKFATYDCFHPEVLLVKYASIAYFR